MSGPMEQDQSSRIPADVVSELERLRSQVAERRECVAQFDVLQSHESWVGVASSPGGVARVAAGAGRVESACVRDIKSHHNGGSRSVEDCCVRIEPRAQCVEKPSRQESRGVRERSFVRDGHFIDDAEVELLGSIRIDQGRR